MNALLAQLMSVTRGDPDKVPEGWKTTTQWAKEFGLSNSATKTYLLAGIRAGIVERKKFRAGGKSGTVLTPYYRELTRR